MSASIVRAAIVLSVTVGTSVVAQNPAPPADQRPTTAFLEVPRLDAGIRIQALRREMTPIGSVVREIADMSRLFVHYDRVVPELSKTWTGNLVDTSLEKVLDVVLKANGMAFTVLGPREVFVYSDGPANRENHAWQVRTFSLLYADPSALAAVLNRQFVTTPVPAAVGEESPSQRIRPIIVPSQNPPTITVRATGEKMAAIAKLIAENDKR